MMGSMEPLSVLGILRKRRVAFVLRSMLSIIPSVPTDIDESSTQEEWYWVGYANAINDFAENVGVQIRPEWQPEILE